MIGRKDKLLTLTISSDEGVGIFISDSLAYNKEDLMNGMVAGKLHEKATNLADIVIERLLRRTK